MALLGQSNANDFVLGDAFFTSFLGVFDVKNDRLGLAVSSRAPPGGEIKCRKHCIKVNSGVAITLFILFWLVVGLLIFFLIKYLRR